MDDMEILVLSFLLLIKLKFFNTGAEYVNILDEVLLPSNNWCLLYSGITVSL